MKQMEDQRVEKALSQTPDMAMLKPKRETMGYEDFLMKLLFFRYVDLRSLQLIGKFKSDTSRFVTKGLKEGHIKKVKFELSQKNKKREARTIVCYSITKIGIQYLHDATQHEWFSEIRNEIIRMMSLTYTYERSKQDKYRMTLYSRAIIIAGRAGASIDKGCFQDQHIFRNELTRMEDEAWEEGEDWQTEERTDQKLSDSNRILLTDILNQVIDEELYNQMELFTIAYKPDDANRIEFHGNNTMKHVASKFNSVSDGKDFVRGRYQGVLDSYYKSVLVYAEPVFGLAWSEWFTQNEQTAFRIWKKTKSFAHPSRLGIEGNEMKDCIAIFVENEIEFEKMWNNKYGKRKGEDTGIGGDVDKCYIIPVSDLGSQFLSWLMLRNDAEYNKQLADDRIQNLGDKLNDHRSCKDFVIKDKNGIETAFNLQFDVKVLERVAAYASKHPEQIFNVVCCDWQTKYYWKVLPENVQCIVYRFPEYIMPTPKTSPEAIPHLPKVDEEKEKRIAAKRAKELLGSE